MGEEINRESVIPSCVAISENILFSAFPKPPPTPTGYLSTSYCLRERRMKALKLSSTSVRIYASL